MPPSVDANKKLWTLQSALVDHTRIMFQLPMMLISPLILSATEMEAVQAAVSDANSCNLSATYRRETSRMVGLNLESDSSGLESWIHYGQSFGLKDGVGREVDTFYQEIKERNNNSFVRANAAKSVAFFSLWMDLMGNTILGFLRGTICGKGRSEQNALFELLFFAYYIVPYIFFVISAILFKIVPTNPPVISKFIYKIIHIIQVLVAANFIIPFGIIGVITLPLYICTETNATPLPSRNDYTFIPPTDIEENRSDHLFSDPNISVDNDDEHDDISDPDMSITTEGEFFTVKLVKPAPESKVGIRFGTNRAGQIMITNMKEGSIAAAASDPGLKIGDLVKSINGTSMDSKRPKVAAATLMGSTGTVTLLVSRSGGTIIDDEATV